MLETENAALSQAETGNPSFPNANFKATHNSYSGEECGSFTEQLDRGVRFLELDINQAGFPGIGDYLIGHGSPGNDVSHEAGNPATNLMQDWLGLIASWSRANPTHAPITIGLDLKDNLSAATSTFDGNLTALNELVHASLGEQLYRAADLVGPWPDVDALRGRIMTVLSGDQTARQAYLRTLGDQAAVAVNASGAVVALYRDTRDGAIWSWTGKETDGRVTWQRNDRLTEGQTPAICLNNQGWTVAVWERDEQLYYRAGRLTEDGAIAWGGAYRYDSGVSPTVRFTDLDGTTFKEIHLSESTGKHWQHHAVLNPERAAVVWDESERTDEPLFDVGRDRAGDHDITVRSGIDQAGNEGVLLYDSRETRDDWIRPEQVTFVEFQKGNAGWMERCGLWFYAASASNTSWGGEQREAGKIVRLWGFDQRDTGGIPVNFPATDTPYAAWYESYCAEIGTIA